MLDNQKEVYGNKEWIISVFLIKKNSWSSFWTDYLPRPTNQWASRDKWILGHRINVNQHYKYVKILVHGGHNENKYYKCKKENELILWYIYDTSLAGFVNPEEYNQENKDGENAIALAEGIFKKKNQSVWYKSTKIDCSSLQKESLN